MNTSSSNQFGHRTTLSKANVLKSPLCSHAFNPKRLPLPKPIFDLALTLLPEVKKRGFETVEKSRQEDALRAKALQKSSILGAKSFGELLGKSTHSKNLLLSTASSFYMRIVRRRLIGEVQRLFRTKGYADHEIVFFTLIHPKWYCSSGALKKCDPKRLKAILRRYLSRAGVTKADGMIFAGLHGEFDRNGYQLHYHGIAVGQKAISLEALRGKFGFASTKRIYRPIEIAPLVNAPRQMSYLVQSFWPTKKRYLDADGNSLKKRKKSRVPSPQHEEILIWLAQQKLFDLILMNGLRLGKFGLTSNASVHEFSGRKEK